MGQEISTSHFSPEDFDNYYQALEQETALLNDWFVSHRFSQRNLVAGYELEAWLIDQKSEPSASNHEFLQLANSPLLSPELARFNVELNNAPHDLSGNVLSLFERDFVSHWQHCQQVAQQIDCRMLSIGILPTLRDKHLTLKNISSLERYRALNEQVLKQREHEPFHLNITGRENLQSIHRDVMLESATTSFQVHLQVTQETAVRYYNASIIVSAPMVAISANSPFLFGKDLWSETRIPLFEQAVNIGGYDGAAHGPVHRVSFGTGYARQSLMECFNENLHHFPVLLPMQFDQDSVQLKHLALHNGTIWRWNRPLIGFDEDGTPHLRIEHRVMPSGPSMVDNIANMAFFYGLVHFYATKQTPPETEIEFSKAKDNFYLAAQQGTSVRIDWPQCNRCGIRQLVLDRFLEEAKTGLSQLKVDQQDIEYYLGIIQARIEHDQTGTDWQREFVKQQGRDMRRLTQTYYHNQQTNEPVHCWDFVSYS
ncbi:MAG TPA: glutamate-cysteine ligase family protein [Gammaproteobacteria bacterium]